MKSVWIAALFCVSISFLWADGATRVSHTFPSGKFQLEAELVTPERGSRQKAAVVFVQGSSGVEFSNYTPGFTDTLIEGTFLPRDIAVFYYNKRGIGKSTGNWKWSSIESRADDVLAAVRYLRTLPYIDPDRIGILGHSQGGWVVQLAGSLDPRIDFVISLAGPAVTVREQDLKMVELSLRCEGLTGEELERKVEKRDRAHNRMISAGGIFPFFQLRMMRNILPFDPASALQGLTQPSLLAFAGYDSMVPVDQNRPRFDLIFPEGAPDNITWHTEPGTDHMFRITDTVCFDYSGKTQPPYADSFVEYLGSWVDGNVVK